MEYQALIDHLAKIRPCITIQWVRKGWPNLPENRKVNKFLSELSHEQKEILGNILQQAKDEGIGAVLDYLTEDFKFLPVLFRFLNNILFPNPR